VLLISKSKKLLEKVKGFAFDTILLFEFMLLFFSNGQSRGIGFVRYNTKQEALAAVQNLNRQILPGSSVPLQVEPT
jgi:RNA recognition motif-containing protein